MCFRNCGCLPDCKAFIFFWQTFKIYLPWKNKNGLLPIERERQHGLQYIHLFHGVDLNGLGGRRREPRQEMEEAEEKERRLHLLPSLWREQQNSSRIRQKSTFCFLDLKRMPVLALLITEDVWSECSVFSPLFYRTSCSFWSIFIFGEWEEKHFYRDLKHQWENSSLICVPWRLCEYTLCVHLGC